MKKYLIGFIVGVIVSVSATVFAAQAITAYNSEYKSVTDEAFGEVSTEIIAVSSGGSADIYVSLDAIAKTFNRSVEYAGNKITLKMNDYKYQGFKTTSYSGVSALQCNSDVFVKFSDIQNVFGYKYCGIDDVKKAFIFSNETSKIYVTYTTKENVFCEEGTTWYNVKLFN